MGKMEDAIRADMQRIVQRELRAQVVPLAKAVRELKRALSQTQKQLALVEKRLPKPSESAPVLPGLEAAEEEIAKARLSPDLIRALRRRLGVSQSQFATLVGVTPGAVAQWELGLTKPQGRNRVTIVAMRRLGRHDVARMLEERKAGDAASRSSKAE
jgi:DNA-binding transcriptional regulator YiaG